MVDDDVSLFFFMLDKPLTPKQEAFAQAVAGGMSQSDAYRKAYNAGNMGDQSVWVNASKLMSDAKVSLRVADLKAKLEAMALWSREDSVNTLKRIVELALDADGHAKAGDGVNAVQVLNKMHGYDAPTKLEISGTLHHAPAYDYSQLDDNTLWALQRAKLPPA